MALPALRTKFGPFWGPFEAYLQTSSVSVEDLDGDTDVDRLLEEVDWPPFCRPNAAQRSALKRSLRRFWAAVDDTHPAQPPPVPSTTIAPPPILPPHLLPQRVPTPPPIPLEDAAWSLPKTKAVPRPQTGADPRTVSRSRVEPLPALPAATVPREFFRGHHGLAAGRKEDEHTALLLTECLPPGVAEPTVAGGRLPSQRQPRQKSAPRKPGARLEADLLQLVDALLDGPTETIPSNGRVGNEDLYQLADALLREDEPRHRAFPPVAPGARRPRLGSDDFSPSQSTERAIDSMMLDEFRAFKERRVKSAPRGCPDQPTKSLRPNFRGRARSASRGATKVTLAARDLELHEACGISSGTVLEHWLAGWRSRGSPNRAADLRAAEEAARQLLSSGGCSRPAVDSWALDAVLRTYGNAPTELLRNMIADDVVAKADRDGDEALNLDEFRQLFQETHGITLTPEMLRRAWAAIDEDGSGEVDFAELMRWLDKEATAVTGQLVPEH